MKTIEKISIDELDGKRFKIRLVEPIEEKKAILTHYLHNIKNVNEHEYQKDALQFLN
ncbi:MAG: DNA (cytosine-5-)-methyltransferase, partial [Crocinitomicaceae bacterium]|nr:DNA (cytosine-5-)-methyltransferase [Crocinitomicaceae bacterium]